MTGGPSNHSQENQSKGSAHRRNARRHLGSRWPRPLIFVAWAGALLLVVSSSAAAALPPGWAEGGSPSAPGKQIAADKAAMPADCAENAALLFRVRGSGEDYGRDRLGTWAYSAGRTLIKAGWRVRDMQAIYPAFDTPSLPAALARPAVLKEYRDVATKWALRVREHLEQAWERCKKRTILVAGYSLGNVVLRYVLPKLPRAARDRIASVDLFADPTADARVDRILQHPSNLVDARLTEAGVDTVGGRTLWRFVTLGAVDFEQTPYPQDLAPRVYQYCAEGDLVCEFKLGNPIVDLAVQGKVHKSYAFAAIGVAATRRVPVSSPLTMVLFRSLGPWRLGMGFRTRAGLTRSQYLPSQTVGGESGDPCVLPPHRKDRYGGITLYWRDWPASPTLWSIVTTRAGDRSADGFVIGKAAMAEVRRRYRTGVTEFRSLDALGRWELFVAGPGRTYSQFWFDARGTLRALTTGHHGC